LCACEKNFDRRDGAKRSVDEGRAVDVAAVLPLPDGRAAGLLGVEFVGLNELPKDLIARKYLRG